MSSMRCSICETSIFNCTCEKALCPVCESSLPATQLSGETQITHCGAHCDCLNCGNWMRKEKDDLLYNEEHPEFCSEDCFNAYHGYGDEDHEHEWDRMVIYLTIDSDGEILEVKADDLTCDCGTHIHTEDNEDKINDKLLGEFLNLCE